MESKTGTKKTIRGVKLGAKSAGVERVCRTCMSPSELHPLFPQAAHQRSFERALFLSTGLQIEVNDGLPQNICRHCAKIIESAMRFRSQSQAIEKKLRQYFKYKKKSEPLKSEPSEASLQDSKAKILRIPEIKVENQPKDEVIVEIEHIKKDDEFNVEKTDDVNSEDDNTGPESPGTPSPTYSDDEEIYSYSYTTSTSRRPYLDLIEGPMETKGPIKCKICKKFSKSINAFEKHAMSHMGYEILCEFCARRCVSNMQLLRHQRAKHGLARDNSYACSYCDFQALDKEQLESHERRIHTKERPYVCDECGEAFYTKRVLVQHGYCHKTEKPFQCNLCPSKFKIRSRLTSHKNFVHSKRYKYTYGCYVCPKIYTKPFEARKHLFKIHGIPKDQQGKVPRYNREDQ